MRNNNLKENYQVLVEFLSTHPGMLKTSYSKLAHRFNVPYESAAEAVRAVKVIFKALNDPEIKKSMDKNFKEALIYGETVYEAPIKLLPKPFKGDPRNVLVLADTHEPFCKPGYLEFCREIQEKYNCGKVIHIGDEVDLCAISQWEKDPNGHSAETEAALAQEKMQDWYRVFPEVSVCIGNHTARPFRLARTAGIPSRFIKTYEEAWGAPKGWKWADHWEYMNVWYTHGTGLSGARAAITLASQYRQNCVIGHIHTEAGIQYNASRKDLVWGMQLGGAIDDKQYAFAYAKDQMKKSIVGCGVVLNGELPLYLPMPL